MRLVTLWILLALFYIVGSFLMHAQTVPAQPNRPEYPISALATVDFYTTQEAYAAKFGSVPKYDPAQAIKNWVDPDAVSQLAQPGGPAQDFKIYSVFDPVNLTEKQAANSLEWLASVNIPPTQVGTVIGYQPNPKGSVAFPVRALASNEQFSHGTPMSGPVVIRIDLLPSASATSVFTDADRALLKAIAAKLGVN
jgi:hypothetical protein